MSNFLIRNWPRKFHGMQFKYSWDYLPSGLSPGARSFSHLKKNSVLAYLEMPKMKTFASV
jgi:hypothetical protein